MSSVMIHTHLVCIKSEINCTANKEGIDFEVHSNVLYIVDSWIFVNCDWNGATIMTVWYVFLLVCERIFVGDSLMYLRKNLEKKNPICKYIWTIYPENLMFDSVQGTLTEDLLESHEWKRAATW